MKVRDMEKLAKLLDDFAKVRPSHETMIRQVQTLAEDEVFETKRRGEKETPKKD
jgi:hypothetical protein